MPKPESIVGSHEKFRTKNVCSFKCSTVKIKQEDP